MFIYLRVILLALIASFIVSLGFYIFKSIEISFNFSYRLENVIYLFMVLFGFTIMFLILFYRYMLSKKNKEISEAIKKYDRDYI